MKREKNGKYFYLKNVIINVKQKHINSAVSGPEKAITDLDFH